MSKKAIRYKGAKAPIKFTFPWLTEHVDFVSGKSSMVENGDAERLVSEFPRSFAFCDGKLEVFDGKALPSGDKQESEPPPQTPAFEPLTCNDGVAKCPYCDKEYKEDHGRWEARLLEHIAENHPAEIEKHIPDEGV